jgi:hypothetical protein
VLSAENLADCLTKTGAPTDKLRYELSTRILDLVVNKYIVFEMN